MKIMFGRFADAMLVAANLLLQLLEDIIAAAPPATRLRNSRRFRSVIFPLLILCCLLISLVCVFLLFRGLAVVATRLFFHFRRLKEYHVLSFHEKLRALYIADTPGDRR